MGSSPVARTKKEEAKASSFLACIYKGDTISQNATQNSRALHSLNDRLSIEIPVVNEYHR
jgi:hypothetical protein